MSSSHMVKRNAPMADHWGRSYNIRMWSSIYAISRRLVFCFGALFLCALSFLAVIRSFMGLSRVAFCLARHIPREGPLIGFARPVFLLGCIVLVILRYLLSIVLFYNDIGCGFSGGVISVWVFCL